jgi:hypothetical protein
MGSKLISVGDFLCLPKQKENRFDKMGGVFKKVALSNIQRQFLQEREACDLIV